MKSEGRMRVNQKEIIRLYGLYQCGMSLAKLAKNHGNGLSRQQIFYYFKALGLKTRSKKLKEKIEFNGDFYTRNHFGYYRKTYGDRKHLHRAVWEKHNGVIAPKCCKNCMTIIQDKGLGPAYYERREFCSKLCFYDYCKKNGQTIGNIRVKKLERELSEAA